MTKYLRTQRAMGDTAKPVKQRKQMSEEQKAATLAKRKATLAAKKATAPENSTPQNEVIQEVKESCTICMDPYNRADRVKVTCSFCSKPACRKCVQTFLTTTTNDPHCMHCSRGWDRDFLDDNLTISYRIGDYKKHRENILMERETALLPATQYRAEQLKEADRMEAELLPPVNERIRDLYDKISILQRKINEVYATRTDIQNQLWRLRNGTVKENKQAAQFVRKCPDGDCRGFLSTQWKCGLCSKWACSECHEIKGDSKDAEHTCKPENVATAKLIAKDSRSCPGCGEVITKIEGCDQMWCPMCHTAFSWKTGQKETGVIHNPHFYEYQRRMNNGEAPRVAGDVPCGGVPTYRDVRYSLAGQTAQFVNLILDFHRVVNHTQHVELQRYHNVFNALDNEDLRIEYLLNKKSTEEMKVEIQRREKKREKERALRRALEVLVQAGTDILRRVIDAKDKIDTQKKIAEELEGLRVYVNELFAKIHERMKLSAPQFDTKWRYFFPFSSTYKKREAEAAKAKEKLEEQKKANANTGDPDDTEDEHPVNHVYQITHFTEDNTNGRAMTG